jgi:hypothetical protein
MKKEWSDPIIEQAKIRSKRPPTRNPETEGMGARVVGGTGLGVVEGGLHHDLSMAEGATAGGFGSATGEVGRRVLGKSAKYWREKDQAIVDWGEAQGMKYLPGMETGRRGAQKFESELKKSSFGDALYQHDLANMQVKNRIAFEAAGMDPKLADNVTPESITKHIEDLKSGYESIEARSIGRIERSNRKAMQDIINGEKAAGTKSSKRTAKMLEAYKSNIEGMSTIKRDKRGRFKKATFDGKAYKDIRSRLKADMKSAANNNRWGEHSALKAFTAQLDEALERGVKDFGGEATVQEWKDLNEKYAVSQLLFKKGTTVNADFDPARLRENLMQHDPIRTITGQGGRIKDLQKLVKLDALERGQAASGFESVDMEPLIHGADKRGPIQSLINTPLAQYVPTLPKMYIGLYKHGYPTTTGALWMNRKGAYEPSRYIRAAAQGSQLHKDAKDGTAKAFNTGKTFAEKWWNGEKDEEK